jgi:hypothetical protein
VVRCHENRAARAAPSDAPGLLQGAPGARLRW